ncbi:fibrobacter succinogenes major paralogous domain-containing protein [Echinicola sp. 20G]|uniref:fibrobacter succinogenes major paralogous domain-containing protein n=1 Tax=Echinicola sp. 20G TaxID=2781961 RepID=UPI00190FCEB5|nr:fibrobacter succinogenes major paralogous domain-containing protein [Echinicola sp. 20G]
MKNSIYYLSLLFLLTTSCVQENLEAPKMGMVSFSKVTFEHFGGLSPSARVLEKSEWKHIFKESATLIITHKETGAEYSLQYNPNDFTEAYQIQLPYGEYTVFSEVAGGDFEKFLPFTITGEFTLAETSLEISLQGSTEYGLVTVKKEFVLSANLDGEHELEICDQGFTLYAYVKDGLNPTLTIYENFNGQALLKELDIAAYNHYHFYLKLTEVQGTVNLIELAIGPFEYHEEFFEIEGEQEITSVTDADGNEYKVVKIGEQYWMAEDLQTTSSCEGHSLLLYDPEEFTGNYPPDHLPAYTKRNDKIYYNFRSTNSPGRQVCPCGWHVPSDEEWTILERFLGLTLDEGVYGYERGRNENIGGKLKSISGWRDPNIGATNEVGFNAKPSFPGVPSNEDSYAQFWSSTQYGDWLLDDNRQEYTPLGFGRELTYNSQGIYRRRDLLGIYFTSIRCVKD